MESRRTGLTTPERSRMVRRPEVLDSTTPNVRLPERVTRATRWPTLTSRTVVLETRAGAVLFVMRTSERAETGGAEPRACNSNQIKGGDCLSTPLADYGFVTALVAALVPDDGQGQLR